MTWHNPLILASGQLKEAGAGQQVNPIRIRILTASIPDDGVLDVVCPTEGGGALIVHRPDSNFSVVGFGGLMLYDVGTGFAALKVGGGGDFNVLSSTPTGTTGTDGDVNVGVKADHIVIENRTGAAADFGVTFL